jgi:protein SCO1/2
MKRGYWIGLILIAFGLVGVAAGRLGTATVNSTAAAFGSVPNFSLTESSGRVVTLKDLSGEVWIADFIFTHCAGTCPLITAEMGKLRKKVSDNIAMVSFTVDPLHDTPEVLAQYAKQAGADNRNWMFLTGDRTALRALTMDGFKMALDDTQGSELEPITHSARFVLVDKQGRIRGYYDGTDEDDLKRLAEDAKKLL